MKIKDLINLEIILNIKHTKEELRAFGLANKVGKLQQLQKFIKSFNLDDGSQYCIVLNKAVMVAVFVSFVFGIIGGFGLLKFGFGEFVNIIYFILIAVIVPIVFGVVNLIYIFKSPTNVPLPAIALQKIVNFFAKENNFVNLDKRVLHSFNMATASLISLVFSFGLLIALVVVGVGRDLPFGWSTTLNINNETFYNFINFLAIPIAGFVDIPTVQIIENSRYFGGEIMRESFNKSSDIHFLWWQYLIGTTITYGLVLRAIIYIIAKIKLTFTIDKIASEKAKNLLELFNTPLISTHQKSSQKSLNIDNKIVKKIDKIDNLDAMLGWAIDKDKIALIADKEALNVKNFYSVGGLEPIEADLQVVDNMVNKKVVLIVNSYEVPTLDFTDFLQQLSKSAKEVIVILKALGNLKQQEFEIWANKIAKLELNNIYLKVLNDS